MCLATRTEAILLTALVITIIVAAAAYVYMQRVISNVGRIKGVGVEVYSDANATKVLQQIDWGWRTPGEVVAVNFYVKNTNNTNVTLSMSFANWNPPSLSGFMMLSWNYTNSTILQPSQIIPVKLTLTISSSITGIDNFSFDIIIQATEYAP